MLGHHLQRHVIHTLASIPSARFSELRPQNIDGNVFTYHIKQLITQKLIYKTDTGAYALTPDGMLLGINVKRDILEVWRQAHPILLLVLRTPDDEWLLHKRLTHPLYNKSGFVFAEPMATERIDKTASQVFAEKTGLTATFVVKGSGYIRVLDGQIPLSFTTFTLLLANSYTGQLQTTNETGQNYWQSKPNFEDEGMMPSMRDLAVVIQKEDKHFWLDLTY